ncbi:putative conserved oligomeric Golgi complex subunit 1-like [Apostichopus japonicus]|uniref:Conserved oligomeric Golgi complex subunit 1 n=1 Tax=Stichopus japonicus TaxID=307972 RepID=A0A2G8LM68_STIJA|nr:putative conserved oligomeric Golgi complex subunit 1-like [Apostichopus japonicus]
MDTDELFVKYTVDEIRTIEKSTSERYRDLIEAADTITEMKNCSAQISNAVQDLQKHCVNLQKTMMTRGVAGVSKESHQDLQSKKKFYAISSEIKLLVDIPDRSSRKILKDSSMSDQKTAESLCSILLLEDSSPRQVFAEFLLARKSAIQTCLTPDLHTTSVKTQVCSVTRVAERTLRQIHSIFYNDEASGDCSSLLFDILSAVCNSHSPGNNGPYHIKLEVGNFGKYLPAHIKEQCVHLYVLLVAANFYRTEDEKASWKSVCEKVLKRKLSLWSEFLRSLFITRIQGIIQDALEETVTETQRLIAEATDRLDYSAEERSICSYVWRESGLDIPSEAAWDRE